MNKKNICEWHEYADGYTETDCMQVFQSIENSIIRYKMKYCWFCGKKLKRKTLLINMMKKIIRPI